MDLGLLLASADDHAPYLPGGLLRGDAETAPRPEQVDPGRPPLPKHLTDDGASPNDLRRQRWGVIVPQEGGDELFARIADLVTLRQRDQGAEIWGDAPGRPFKVPPKMSFEDASRWIQETLNSIPDPARPRYLLLLGDPEQISLELGQALSIYSFVGRLAFDNLDGYSEYAAKVVEHSRPEAWRTDPRALSFTVRTEFEDDVPDDGYRKLMDPMVRSSVDAAYECPLPFIDVSPKPGLASASRLMELARDPRPTVLMSMSHGVGRSRSRRWSDEEIRRFQGNMSFGRTQALLGAEDVAKGDFLPGGIWFYFACFGAGTPGTSAYWHWLRELSRARGVLAALPKDDRPFIAALPQAALANRRGPLAVMGHLDLAWNYSYDAALSKRRGQAGRFVKLGKLAEGDKHPRRVGQVLHSMMGDLPQIQDDLANMYDDDAKAAAKRAAPPKPVDASARAHLWMLRQDLRAYVLLGDPAVHLPVTPKATPPRPPPPDMQSLLGFTPSEPARTGSARPDLDPDKVVEGVLACIRGDKTPEGVARELSVEVDEVRRWVNAYKSAGRDTIARLLGRSARS